MRKVPVLLLCGVLFACGAAQAAEQPKLKRVLLSTGGVGYFEFQAKISGDDELSLPVRVDQIDDILKSLVVFDSKGGVGTVSLPSRLPDSELFRDLPFDSSALGNPADLLSRLVGAEIDVSGPRSVTGRIAGVTETSVTDKSGRTTTVHRVSVLGTRGIEQFVYEDARSISFRDRKLQEAFSRALGELAQRGSDLGRTLTITSHGNGTRTLTIGYVVAAPLWKSAYRLVLPNAADGTTRGRLQGWAILENASGLDWDEVELTLASGNPVTFRQSLYDAYYVDRPEVPVEVLGRVLPKPDEGAIAYGEGRAAKAAKPEFMPPPSPAPAYDVMEGGGGVAAEAPPPPPGLEPIIVTAARRKEAASSEDATTQVMFRFKEPVTVARGKSFAVPVIDTVVPAARIALYNADTLPARPLSAVRLRNETGAGLPPGVLTLYEPTTAGGNAYIGDARLAPLPAGQARLLSYAVDEKTLVNSAENSSQRIEKGKIAGGMLEISVVEQSATVYTVAAPTGEARDLIVEHPRYEPDEKLAAPKGPDIEQTPNTYRIPFHVDAGATASLGVVVDRPVSSTLALVDLNGDRIEAYLHAQEISPELAAIFKELAKRRAPVDQADKTIADVARERAQIYSDQERLRKNLDALPERSALRARYLDQMNMQEDRLATLRRTERDARATKDKALAALKAYVAGLEL